MVAGPPLFIHPEGAALESHLRVTEELGGGCIQVQPCKRQQWSWEPDPGTGRASPRRAAQLPAPLKELSSVCRQMQRQRLQTALSKSRTVKRKNSCDTHYPKTAPPRHACTSDTESQAVSCAPHGGATSTASPDRRGSFFTLRRRPRLKHD